MQLKDFLPIKVDEEMRLKLLEEEFKMRSKQPEPWTKTKYRKYANFGRIKAKTGAESEPTKLVKAKPEAKKGKKRRKAGRARKAGKRAGAGRARAKRKSRRRK